MSALLETPQLEDLRTQLQVAAPGYGDRVVTALVAACEAVKKRRFECRKCGTSNEVEINDAVAAANAAKTLTELTAGRSPVADQDEAQALTIVRTVAHTLDAKHALTLMDKALETLGDTAPAPLLTLRQELLSSLPHAHAHEA